MQELHQKMLTQVTGGLNNSTQDNCAYLATSCRGIAERLASYLYTHGLNTALLAEAAQKSQLCDEVAEELSCKTVLTPNEVTDR